MITVPLLLGKPGPVTDAQVVFTVACVLAGGYMLFGLLRRLR